jgi:hypothetical protein
LTSTTATAEDTVIGAIFHLDDWDRDYPINVIWLQMDVLEACGEVILRILGPGNEVGWQPVKNVRNPDGTYAEVDFARTRWDPLQWEIVFESDVPLGGTVWIDDLRIGTGQGGDRFRDQE